MIVAAIARLLHALADRIEPDTTYVYVDNGPSALPWRMTLAEYEAWSRTQATTAN